MTFLNEKEKELWTQTWTNLVTAHLNQVERAEVCDSLIKELRQRTTSSSPPVPELPPKFSSIHIRPPPDFNDSQRMLLIEALCSSFGLEMREARRRFKTAAQGLTLTATQAQISNFNSKIYEHNIAGMILSVTD